MKGIIDYFNEFFRLLRTMQLTDMIDIALVTFLVYKLIRMIRSTSTARIAKALMLILLVSWMTEIFELNVLNFLIARVLELGLIALVVLFQPEIRRAVERMGGANLREILSPKEHNLEINDVISQTVKACEVMAQEKVGALMVFERASHLDEYMKTGTVVDGKVTDRLIRNIFFPNSALHDGAMVLRDNRVYSAGCVLPLSQNRQLSADLGTRHRAGVGVSEVSDAVVVIVSEETGTISVAIGGMLKRHLSPQTLEKLLTKELAPEQEPSKRRRILEKFKTPKIKGKDEK